eukprot:TRINITY_DN13560_c0_g4_i2.p1 TRINITY_DN13560_c0_g4~~TRINITY_DN13560_c0_g4_i2.p1  ORF type:complete len:620 (+),score=100.07 TRINITY_DN13560_c0_g4_i2:78-1937(+)
MGNSCGTPITQMNVEPLVVEDKVGDRDIDPQMLEYMDMLANGFLTEKEVATMQLKMLTSGMGIDSSQENRKLLNDINAMTYLSFVLQRGSLCSKESALYTIKNLSLLPEAHYGILASDSMYRMVLTLRQAKFYNQCRIIVDILINIAKNPEAAKTLFVYHELLYGLEQYMKGEEEIIEVKRGVLFINCMARLPGADQFILQADFFPRMIDWHNNTNILTWPYNDERTSLYIRASITGAINDMLQGRQSKELLIALASLDGAKMALQDIVDGIATKKRGVEADELTRNGLIMAQKLINAGKDIRTILLQPILLQYIYKLLRKQSSSDLSNHGVLNGSKMTSSGISGDSADDFKIDDGKIKEIEDSAKHVDHVSAHVEAQICACELVQAFCEHDLGKDVMQNWDIPKALMQCQKSNYSKLANAAFQALIAFGDKKLVDKLEKEERENYDEEEEENSPHQNGIQQEDTPHKIDDDIEDIKHILKQLKAGDLRCQAQVVNNLTMTQQLVAMLKSDDKNQQKDALQVLSGILSRSILKTRIITNLMNEGTAEYLSEYMNQKLSENKKDSFQLAAWSAHCLSSMADTDATTKAKVAAVLKEEENTLMELAGNRRERKLMRLDGIF